MLSNREFETAQETAERLGMTVRAIQKRAANGKIPGAVKHGKMWMIPKGITLADAEETSAEGAPVRDTEINFQRGRDSRQRD